MKVIKLYASHFTPGQDGGKFANALYKKSAEQMVTIPDRSEGIVKVSS